MYSLLQHNTFGINAFCRKFISYKSVDELRSLLPTLKDELWFHIGRGSNLLFVTDFNGIILHSEIDDFEVISEETDCVYIRIGAGYEWDSMVETCISRGFYGIENLSSIPGEVGASAVQNIGAYGVEVSQFIETVETIDVQTGESKVFKNEDCNYSYRKSIFKSELKNRYIITHVVYRLYKTFRPELNYGTILQQMSKYNLTPNALNAQDLRRIIVEIRQEKLPDPQEIGSAGSFFMNPVISPMKFAELEEKYPKMPHYDVPGGVKVPAGWMIEQCGWKGKRMGNVGVYDKQALVIVNWGNATGKEVVALCNAIQNDVYSKFGIKIYPEVLFI